MEPMTREQFKEWTNELKLWKKLTFTLGDARMAPAEFVKLLHPFDAKLAELVANFALAANAMGNYVEARLGEATVLPRP